MARRSSGKAGANGKRVLVVDVGGSHVKILATGEEEKREADSGPDLTAADMVEAVRTMADGWAFDVVSIGYPGPVVHNKPMMEPANLGRGWRGFDYEGALGHPVKIVNDALMQAVGSYDGGRMLFLGLGTGLGSAMIVENVAQPMELAHMPYKKGRSYEDYVGEEGMKRRGKKKWRQHVFDIVEELRAAPQPEYIVLGGGNVKYLDELPDGARRGDNANAFTGGFRLWEKGGVVVT